jgi:hypothetical protein
VAFIEKHRDKPFFLYLPFNAVHAPLEAIEKYLQRFVDDRPIISLDIHPTAVAAAGQKISPDWKLDGVNILPYLTGEKTGQPHDTLYWRFHDQYAIRRGDWKLVHSRLSSKPQLYNLAQDISEGNDLADKEPTKFKELSDAWAAWNAQLMAPQWQREDATTKGAGKGTGKGALRAGIIEQRFRQYDKNGDGKLSPEEFPGPEFKQIDKNGDGFITLDEARAYYTGVSRPLKKIA